MGIGTQIDRNATCGPARLDIGSATHVRHARAGSSWRHARAAPSGAAHTNENEGADMHVASTPSRGPNATEPHRTVVVGYDGSGEARAAFATAAERAGKGGTVVAVYGAEPATNLLDT